jgi:hypothetical protein
MIEQRANKVRRIQAVETQLRRMEELKLHGLQQRLHQLEADQRGVIEALNGDNPLQGLFVASMARRLGRRGWRRSGTRRRSG